MFWMPRRKWSASITGQMIGLSVYWRSGITCIVRLLSNLVCSASPRAGKSVKKSFKTCGHRTLVITPCGQGLECDCLRWLSTLHEACGATVCGTYCAGGQYVYPVRTVRGASGQQQAALRRRSYSTQEAGALIPYVYGGPGCRACQHSQ
jgi:hypothetical protein